MRKVSIIAGVLSIAVVISGCSSEEKASEERTIKSGFKAEHLHGISYAKDDNIYVATHEGMLSTDHSGDEWVMKGLYDFDFMGYNVLSDGTMITSGHPGKSSGLPNPLGLMISTNNGEKWESLSLLGKVDFHILSSNFTKPNVIYGINQMESNGYDAGIYKSTDKGKEWKLIESTGLPSDLHQVYSLISLPDDENKLIAGTDFGVMESVDGGETWEVSYPERLITALSVIPDTQELISYSITNQEVGIMFSKDGGKTWDNKGFDLGRDAVAYFGINPNDSNKIVFSTFENNVYTTEDGGENWTQLMEEGIIQ